MKKIFFTLFILITFWGHSQRFFENDTVLNVKRTAWTSGIVFTGYSGSMLALQSIWYKDSWSGFQFFDDSREWLGMDKFGHAYTSNIIAGNITSAYRWSGVSRKKSLLIGSSVALGYLSTLELQDGFSKKWGFSWSDIAANTLGIAWYTWQDLVWEEQRFKLKFSVHLSPYAQYRPHVLGNNFAERMLKDYNGQTHWLSVTPAQFLKKSSSFPKWLSFSIGYSIDEKLNGDLNKYSLVSEGGETLHFSAKSQYLFSLDIDFEQFNPKRKWVSVIFKALNHVKVPFPAVIITSKNIQFHPFYF